MTRPWRPSVEEQALNVLSYRMFVNHERTVYVRAWSNGEIEVAFRDDPGATWGPPIRVVEET